MEESSRKGRGRCAVASRSLAAGAVVLDEDPWALVVLDEAQGRRCDYSLKSEAALRRCRITGLSFASRQSQESAWGEFYASEYRAVAATAEAAGHPALSSTAQAVPTPANTAPDLGEPTEVQLAGVCPKELAAFPPVMWLAARCLWRALQQGSVCCDWPWRRLESHWEDLDGEREAQLESRAARCAALVQEGLSDELRRSIGHGGEWSKLASTVHEVAWLLAALEVNAMVVTDEEQRGIALGLFLQGSLFNHDEDPNCTQAFVGRRLQCRTLRPVSKGEELTLAYGELAEQSSARRARLRAQYFFDPFPKGLSVAAVVKRRDADLAEIEVRNGAVWTALTAGVAWGQSTGTCSRSGLAKQQVSHGGAAELVRRLHEQWAAGVKSLTNGEADKAARLLWDAWQNTSEQEIRLGQCHSLRLAIAKDGLDAAIFSERWAEAVAYARALSEICSRVYPEKWPVTGLAMARLAKLELFHGNMAASAAAAEKALRIFAVVLDDSSPLQAEMRQIEAQAHAELRAKQAFTKALPATGPPQSQTAEGATATQEPPSKKSELVGMFDTLD